MFSYDYSCTRCGVWKRPLVPKKIKQIKGALLNFYRKEMCFLGQHNKIRALFQKKNMINTEQTFENDEARTLLLQFDLYFFAFFSLLKPRP